MYCAIYVNHVIRRYIQYISMFIRRKYIRKGFKYRLIFPTISWLGLTLMSTKWSYSAVYSNALLHNHYCYFQPFLRRKTRNSAGFYLLMCLTVVTGRLQKEPCAHAIFGTWWSKGAVFSLEKLCL